MNPDICNRWEDRFLINILSLQQLTSCTLLISHYGLSLPQIIGSAFRVVEHEEFYVIANILKVDYNKNRVFFSNSRLIRQIQ